MKRRFDRWFWYGAAATLALWLLFAFLIVPALIRDAYRGESLPLLNAIISGRDVLPVEVYLGSWQSLARPLTGALLAVLAVIWLWRRYTKQAQAATAWVLGGEHGLRPGALLRYAACLGALGGIVEVGYRAGYQLIHQAPGNSFYTEQLWMGPLSASLAFLIVALLPAALARAARVDVAVSKATFIFGALAVYGVMQVRGISLLPAAELVLSLGIAAAISRFAAKHAERLQTRMVAWSRYVAVVLAVLTAVGLFRLPSISERLALAGAPEARSGSPNILLIILDTVRSKNLSLYGYHRSTTPRLDDWARSGVVYERAISTAPWTLPTHASLFTGRYHFEVGSSMNRPMDRSFPTLAEVLAREGYATAGFVANLLYTTEMSGLHRGFARYEDFPVTPGLFFKSSWLSATFAFTASRLPGVSLVFTRKSAEHVTNDFLNWQRGQQDRPFFAFLNYFDAHYPYEVPEAFRGRFGPPPTGFPGRQDQPTPESLQPWEDKYDAAIAYVDQQLGVIFDSLAAQDLLERTIVVVTSDHGESFGEHGLARHYGSLYATELRVPLVISFPGSIPNDLRIPDAVTLRDLPATLLRLAEVSNESPIPGRSLARHWTSSFAAEAHSPVLAEVDLSPWALRHGGWINPWGPVTRGDMKSMFDGSMHYILNGDGVEELYDLDQDPDEDRDLSGSPDFAPVLRGFRASLAQILGETSEVASANADAQEPPRDVKTH